MERLTQLRDALLPLQGNARVKNCSRVHQRFREIYHTGKHSNHPVFIFPKFTTRRKRTCSPPPVSRHGGEAAAAPRKSGGKPLMDNRATTPGPQHLAPLSLLLHKNNNKQVADLPGGFATVFPTVGAADAEKFPFFCMHI